MTTPAPTGQGAPARPARPTGGDEIRTTEQFRAFIAAQHRRFMQNGYTLEMVAAEVRGKLRKASGLERLAAARKARSVTRHITRAAALQEASGRELARAWARYQTEYGEQLNPQRRRQQGWQFRPDGRGQ